MTLQELVNLLSNHLASVSPNTPVLVEGSNFSVLINKDDEKKLFVEIKKHE